jgi:hypothetical protein
VYFVPCRFVSKELVVLESKAGSLGLEVWHEVGGVGKQESGTYVRK